MNKVTKIQAAYIAGFFDGEGCVSTGRRHLAIKLAQKNRGVLDYIVKTLGYGKVRRCNNGHHSMYIYSKPRQTRFIKLVLPYSIVKRSQLEVGLQLLNLIPKSGYPRLRLSSDDRRQRALLSRKLKELKI